MTVQNTQIVAELSANDFALIDMDTGTVLGTNVKLVRMSNLSEEEQEEVSSSDSAAWEHAHRNGEPLLVDADFIE